MYKRQVNTDINQIISDIDKCLVIVVHSLSCVLLFVTHGLQHTRTQAFLSFTVSRSFLKLMSIESVMPSSRLILCHSLSFCPQSFPASESFSTSQLFTSGGQSIGASASSLVLLINIQDIKMAKRIHKMTKKCMFNIIKDSVQFSSISQSCPTLCNPMNCSTPGLPVHHQLPEFTQIHVHRVSDAIQPSHPLWSPSPPAPIPPSISLFQWVNTSHEAAKVLEFQLQHHSFQRNPRADLLQNGLVGSPCSPRDSQESSPTPQFKSINSSALSLLHSPTLTSIHDYWKNHSLD